MPFKIVQTIEDGETCLSVVPAKWETNGMLFWPKRHLFEKFSRNEESIPDKKKWEQMKCVKKREFHSRKEAEAELERMEQVSDTEIDERRTIFQTEVSPKLRLGSQNKRQLHHDGFDFNSLIPAAERLVSVSCNAVQTKRVLPQEMFDENIELVGYK